MVQPLITLLNWDVIPLIQTSLASTSDMFFVFFVGYYCCHTVSGKRQSLGTYLCNANWVSAADNQGQKLV